MSCADRGHSRLPPILFDDLPQGNDTLGPGMSVVPTVRVR